MKRSVEIGFCCLFVLFCFHPEPIRAQSARDEKTGFGEIELGAPLSTLPFSCARPVFREAPYESVRVRVWHAFGVVQRIDVLYRGKSAETGEDIQSSPITLAQAVRGHSIRYGRKVPRLGFGGCASGVRIIVDDANGIAYFAETAFVTGRVKEVRYLQMDDPLILAAMAFPLSEQGEWLLKEARFAPRYKNLPADAERAPSEPAQAEEIGQDEIARRLEKVSSEARVYAQATLMLSARVMQSLEKKEAPDPLLSARLRKTYARLHATTSEARCLLNHHPDAVTARDRDALPVELAGEAEARMKELRAGGFGTSGFGAYKSPGRLRMQKTAWRRTMAPAAARAIFRRRES